MKPWFIFLVLPLAAFGKKQTVQYMATVQVAVNESSPRLMNRSRRLVEEQFSKAFRSWPALRNRPYQIRRAGNEMILTLLSKEDVRGPMEQAIFHMIQNLNGKVRAQGRWRSYRTPGREPLSGFLRVRVAEDSVLDTEVKAISAVSVTLENILHELRQRVGNFSYLVPGECMNRTVSWSFGESGDEPTKTVGAVMSELASFLNLDHEVKNGTYIFKGSCAPHHEQDVMNPGPTVNTDDVEELIADMSVVPITVSASSTRIPRGRPSVYIPLMPLTR